MQQRYQVDYTPYFLLHFPTFLTHKNTNPKKSYKLYLSHYPKISTLIKYFTFLHLYQKHKQFMTADQNFFYNFTVFQIYFIYYVSLLICFTFYSHFYQSDNCILEIKVAIESFLVRTRQIDHHLTYKIYLNDNKYINIVERMRSQYTESQADLGLVVNVNPVPTATTFVFGILLVLMQIGMCIVYGLLVNLPAYNFADPTGQVNFSPIITIVLLFFMVVLGFGSLFAYLKKLVWSALGFNLLIVCLTIQWFFLISIFWAKTNITGNGIVFASQTQNSNSIWLTKTIYNGQLTSAGWIIGVSLTQALKCALANCIGFSAILGRAGPLQAFLIALFGTIGYELNRNIVDYVYMDYGGTYTVFTYGGFMSALIGLILRFSQKNTNPTAKNIKYTGNLFSGSIAFFGASVLFAVFPVITADPNRVWSDGIQYPFYLDGTFTSGGNHIFFTVPLSVWYAIASSCLVGSSFSIFVYEKTTARDFLHSVVAGGVAACSAGVYFTNPVWPMVLGAACGITQALVGGIIEKRVAMNNNIFHTVSFTLFGIQGIIGGLFATIFRAVIGSNPGSFTFETTKPAGYDLAVAAISAALGIGFGILIGLFVLLITRLERSEYFNDYTYWVSDDGIRYTYQEAKPPAPIVNPVIPNVIPKPPPSQDQIKIPTSSKQSDIYIKETTVNVKAKHAYL